MKILKRSLTLLICLMMLTPALAELVADSYYDYLGHRARMLKKHGPYHAWTIEQKAALDAPYDKEEWMGGDNRMISRLPGKDDLTQEVATDKAIATLTREYDLSRKDLETWEKECDFYELGDDQKSWIVSFIQPQAKPEGSYQVYRVEVESPGGKAVYHDVEMRGGLYAPPEDKTSPQPPAEILTKAMAAALDTEWAKEKRLTREILETFDVIPSLIPVGQLRHFSNAHLPEDLNDDQMAWLIDFYSDDPVFSEFYGALEVAFLQEDGQQLPMDPAVNG